MKKRIYKSPQIEVIALNPCMLLAYTEINVVGNNNNKEGGGNVHNDTDVSNVPEPNAKPWIGMDEGRLFE